MKTLYDELGGFTTLRKIISSFYNNLLDYDQMHHLFENVNMERLIDHQTKFFTSLLGGPVSFTDQEIKLAHQRLNINENQFELTKSCLEETLDDFELEWDKIQAVSSAFESKRKLIVQA